MISVQAKGGPKMSRFVGVLMKQERRHGVFLTPDGSFMRGKTRVIGAVVGQEVEFVPMSSRHTDWMRWGMVAVLMLAVMLSGLSVYLTQPVIAAYVTIDINPSLELGIDQHQIVRSVVALNPEGEALVTEVQLMGRQVTEALEVLMAAAAEDGYLGPEAEHLVVITTTAVAGQPTNQVDLTVELENKARAIVAGQEQTVVTSMVAEPEIREEARRQGMSVGKLMVVQKAEEAGIHLDPQELKSADLSQSIRAAGGDLGTILKKENSSSASGDTSVKDKDKEKADQDKPGNGNQGNSKGNSDNRPNGNDKSEKPGSPSDNKGKGNNNGNGNSGNSNNGKSGDAPGQTKR